VSNSVSALDPRSFGTLYELARTYQHLRRYEEAEALLDRVLTLRPDYLEAAIFRAFGSVWGKGDTGPLRTLVSNCQMLWNASSLGGVPSLG
jgi:tetratricopeptide (TPR) repeat protein